uniref:(California timema) hypothetical protein n=1 Tax=Timema californicum TaxID=61474 RepID=A0A7R9JC14_TIMCA|nr:unnamed protein product [Timema californicum]
MTSLYRHRALLNSEAAVCGARGQVTRSCSLASTQVVPKPRDVSRHPEARDKWTVVHPPLEIAGQAEQMLREEQG